MCARADVLGASNGCWVERLPLLLAHPPYFLRQPLTNLELTDFDGLAFKPLESAWLSSLTPGEGYRMPRPQIVIRRVRI